MSRRPRSAWLLAVLVIPLAACSASSPPRPTPSPAAQATPTPAPSPFTSAFPPALYRARTALVRSIDPEHPTFTVLQVSDHGNRFAYAPWLGTVDIVGLDVYPCNHTESTCDLSKIDDAVAAARQQGLTRFWAVVQDFQDGFYRIPTPDELRLEFEHWDRSSMSGYFVFSWDYKGLSLDTLPDNVAQLKLENLAHGG